MKLGPLVPGPTGRAVLGGGLVALAVLAAILGLAPTGSRDVRYVTARVALPAGTSLSVGDLTTVAMSLAPAASAYGFVNPSEVVGRRLVVPVAAGEPIFRGDLSTPSGASDSGSGRELSIPVDIATADDGHIHPGNWIDILATATGSGQPDTSVIAPEVPVLAIGPDPGGDPTKEVVTVSVATTSEAVAIAQAVAADQILLVLTPSPDSSPASSPDSSTVPSRSAATNRPTAASRSTS
jgi:Flp pilus assembly protein CpaB